MRASRLLLLTGCWLAVAPAHAQQADPPPKPAEKPASAETVPVRERERRVYVPFEDLEKVFEDGGRGVFLPYREFLELWNELTLKREEENKPPPADAVLAGAEYTGTVEGDSAVLDARLTVESFQKGWVSLPLLDKNLPGVGEAETGKAVLRSQADGTELLLPDKGVYEIRLKIYAPVTRRDGRRVLSLQLPVAAVSRLSLTVPGADLEFEVKPSAAFTARENDGQTEFACFFGAGGGSEIAWQARAAEAVMAPLILAETKLRSAIGAGSVSTRAEIRHRILRAPVDSLRLGLPAAQEVLGVTATGLKEWRLEPEAEGRRVLVAVFEKPARDQQTLTLDLEAPLAALPGEARVPEIEVIGAAHAHGEATVTAETQLDAAPRALTAATRVQSAAGSAGEVGVFRLLRQPYEVSFEVTEARPQVEVASQTRLELRRDAALLTAAFHYQVRRVGLFETRIALPPGWTVSEVTGTVEHWQIEGGEAAPVLLARLPKQMTEGIALTVSARQSRGQAEGDVTLPVFKPVAAARHEGVIGVVLPASLEANTKEMGGLQQEDVKALRAGRHADFWQAGAEAGLAFRYLDDAAPGVLALKSRSPQVSVEVLTLLDAREQSTRHAWTLVFDVSYAATDRFVLAVPKAVADTLRLVDPQIKEINRDYQPAQPFDLPEAETFALWEVVLRNETLGRFQLSASHEQPAAIEAGGSATVSLLPLHVPSAFQETGQVAVSKADSLEIREAQAETLEEIDSRELRPEAGFTGVFLAYKYRSLPVKLAVELAKNSYFAVPQAVVTHADLTTAAASDRAQTTEAVYWVKNNDLQFLEVSLPAGARLVSDAQVGAEAQQPMRREGSEALLIRLPSGVGQTLFPVRLVFEVPSPNPGVKLGARGAFTVPAPHLPAVGVLETRHRLFLPEDWHYTAIDSPLTRVSLTRGWTRARRWIDWLIPVFGPQPATAEQARWSEPPQIETAQRALFGFQVPQQGHLETLRRLGPPAEIQVTFRGGKLTFAYEAAAFLITLLAGLLFGGRSPARRIGLVAAAGFGGLLATGLVGPANMPVARAVMLAAALLAGLWLLTGFVALLTRRKKAPLPPASPPPTSPPPASLASMTGAASAPKPAEPAGKTTTAPAAAAPVSRALQTDDIEEPSVPPMPAADEEDTSKPGA